MGKADVHIHSMYSDGLASLSQILHHVQSSTDLDVIAITDHDCIDGALRARDLAAQAHYRYQVMVGAEISTRDGHLLALDIERLVRAGMSMADTIHAIHEQGGVAVIAHPLSRLCPLASLPVLEALAATTFVGTLGLEGLNGSIAAIGSARRALRLNRSRFGWPELGGSDAHTLRAIGCSFTRFAGHTVEALRQAIRSRKGAAEGGMWPAVEVLRYALGRQRLRQTGDEALQPSMSSM